VGSVGCLKDIKEAISVARNVMEHTNETLLVGDDGNRYTVEPRNKGQDYVPV
jgi:N4-(beta-N-acetylglucosaminyl)-L-asparaginase